MNNAFWEIEGIKGESTSAQGKDQIEIHSFSHGVAMPLTSGPSNTSRASGRCVHQDMTVTMYYDIATPTLSLKCCAGEDIKSMKIHVWKADAAAAPVEYITYTMESCIVTSVSIGGSSGDQPMVTITFNYKKITWDYNQQLQPSPGGKKGKSSTSWSLEENKGK
jgi:type VI secretion system secreted protein Hcp